MIPKSTLKQHLQNRLGHFVPVETTHWKALNHLEKVDSFSNAKINQSSTTICPSSKTNGNTLPILKNCSHNSEDFIFRHKEDQEYFTPSDATNGSLNPNDIYQNSRKHNDCDPWTFSVGNIQMKGISVDDHECHKVIKKFMFDNYFSEASVCYALGLTKSAKGTEVIDREMDMYLRSGASFQAHLISSDTELPELVGVVLQSLWKKDDHYEILGTDTLSWHNAAAELAHELDPTEPQIIWRDYYVQHTYNFAQMQLRKAGKKMALYAALGYIRPELRHIGFGKAVHRIQMEVMGKCDGMVFVQRNFGEEEKVEMTGCSLEDEFRYREVVLEVEGRRVFEGVQKLGRLGVFIGNE